MAAVFQKTVDYPDELAHGYQVTLRRRDVGYGEAWSCVLKRAKQPIIITNGISYAVYDMKLKVSLLLSIGLLALAAACSDGSNTVVAWSGTIQDGESISFSLTKGKYRLEMDVTWENEENTIGTLSLTTISNHYKD